MAAPDPRKGKKPGPPVAEHETVGKVWPERGLPEEYQVPGVRFHEGNMVGMGGSEEAVAEEAKRWHLYEHDQENSDIPQPTGSSIEHKPFAGLSSRRTDTPLPPERRREKMPFKDLRNK